MWKKTEDGSFLDANDRVLFFSADRFERDICLGECCFICGASRGSVPFNDEHVIPEWVQRRFNLFDKCITLPNGAKMPYGRYKVPCCEACNTLMGTVIEPEISEASRDGFRSLSKFANDGGGLKLFVWMGLLFLKTHLKDHYYRFHLDSRAGSNKIGEIYDWVDLHHIHSLVRCFYSGAKVAPEAAGSMAVLWVQDFGGADSFDYGDLYMSQCCFVKLGDAAVVAVMNDSKGAMSYFAPRIERFRGPLSAPQLREVMVEFAFLNLHMKNRPQFATMADPLREAVEIVAFRPQLELDTLDYSVRGEMLFHAVRHSLPHIRVPGTTPDQIEAAIRGGKFTFLFDDDGRFVEHSVVKNVE